VCTCICFSLLYGSHFCYIVVESFAPHYIIVIQRAGVREPATSTFFEGLAQPSKGVSTLEAMDLE
jgi:hypothetical protein